MAEFFRVMHYSYMKQPFTLLAYCVMTNHYHLLIRSPEAPLGKVMGHINRRYSDYYKKKYQYSGYLYGSRYFAKCAENPIGILAVSRYIHRNPIETALPMVNRMEDYPYSSYAFYSRNIPRSILFYIQNCCQAYYRRVTVTRLRDIVGIVRRWTSVTYRNSKTYSGSGLQRIYGVESLQIKGEGEKPLDRLFTRLKCLFLVLSSGVKIVSELCEWLASGINCSVEGQYSVVLLLSYQNCV